MKLPRNLSGSDLAHLLRRYGYEVTRQTGSHLRLTSHIRSSEHHVTIPAHQALKMGTLGSILYQVAEYLQRDRSELAKELFE